MAPEILTYKDYTDLADLWSVGVIMYELFFNKTPYNGSNLFTLVNNIKKTKITFSSKNKKMSNNAIDLLSSLLKKKPENRINWKLFFTHDWFQQILPA